MRASFTADMPLISTFSKQVDKTVLRDSLKVLRAPCLVTHQQWGGINMVAAGQLCMQQGAEPHPLASHRGEKQKRIMR